VLHRLLWCYIYAIREQLAPHSFAGLSPNQVLHIADLVFFSCGDVSGRVLMTPATGRRMAI
jgi:hypothetical protein